MSGNLYKGQKFNDFFWPDSDLEQILIYYNTAELAILSGIIYFVSQSLEKAFEDDEWVLMEDVLRMPDSDLEQEEKEE